MRLQRAAAPAEPGFVSPLRAKHRQRRALAAVLHRSLAPRQHEIREIVRNVAIIEDQVAKALLKHSEIPVEHDRRMAEHDERMERVGHHLEVLANISDEPIRNKADRKRR